MIKKYNQFLNESLLDELKGPTEEEIYQNIKHFPPDEILLYSAKKNFLYGIKKALERGANINYMDDIALRYASCYKNFEMVKFLVQNGANVFNRTAYEYAVEDKSTEIIKYLKNKRIEQQLGVNITEGLNDYLTGPTEEESWKYFGFNKPYTKEELFKYLIDGIRIIKKDEKHFIWKKGKKIMFVQSLKGKDILLEKQLNNERIFYINYNNVYKIYEKIFNMNYKQFRHFIKNMFNKYLNDKININEYNIIILYD